MIVAALSTVTAFVLSLLVNDCQALGKDPNENTLQVNNFYITPEIITGRVDGKFYLALKKTLDSTSS